MKKLSLLVGTLGGAFAGYLFSNKSLRDELANAKDAEEAAKLLGKHLQKDGKKLGKQVKEFVESDDVQQNLQKAKQFASKKVNEAKKEMQTLVKKGAATSKKTAKSAARKAKSTMKSSAKRAKAKVSRSAKK